MRLWKRASDALKDQSSLWQASLSRSHPDIEKAVIRATSHHPTSSRRNIDRVRHWLRLSPSNLSPILRSLASRISKTRSWPVALKGLLLTHALLNSPSPSSIGRLPFDLSSFRAPDDVSSPFDPFVRAYYAFLDHKSATAFLLHRRDACDMNQELLMLQSLQGLIDLLVAIRPAPAAAFAPLVLDVMEGVVVELYEVYGKICRGIATVLLNIYSAGRAEAAMALRVVRNATRQGNELADFLDVCREIRIANAAEFPVIDRIPEEGIRELEEIVEGLRKEKVEMKTVVTQEWERFEEDSVAVSCGQQQHESRIAEAPDLITLF
ncbi:putative clathrin assembly protein At1g25240 [Salvia splendens]|uniref:putative clathrin assembly protein At1g25240 n=1 Tax=Salvia splendens TaxID=180675 RepID=UPI001C258E82|nr:putative clathrin assembly protein At1g25240 [Salvia splendens]